MIASLRGNIRKLSPGKAVIDVHGVGYGVLMPINDWDDVMEGSEVHLSVSTYVREDRLDLYGFKEESTKILFEELIALSGIGPRMGLELCAVPRGLLTKAVREKDARMLMSVKGVGKKSAEKLLVELNGLAERQPEIFMSVMEDVTSKFDHDTIAALSQLGFGTPEIMHALDTLPGELTTTEERVAAALRVL